MACSLCRSSAVLTALAGGLAQGGPVVVAGLVGLAWWWPGSGRPARRRAALASLLAGALAFVAIVLLGGVLGGPLTRPRPFVALGVPPLFAHGTDSSFPSDHTLLAVALAAPLALRRVRGGGPALALAVATGAARVAAAVHYPTDILLSALVALALSLVASRLVTRWLPVLVAAGCRRTPSLGQRLSLLLGWPAT